MSHRYLLVACISIAACSTASSKDAQGIAPSAQPAIATATGAGSSGGTGTIIAVLQTRDRRIELHSGTRVTVRNNEGDLVAEDITLDELATRDPFLYDVCRASFASNGNNGSSFMDARLDTHRDGPKAMGLLGD